MFKAMSMIRGPNKLEPCPTSNNHKKILKPCKIHLNTRFPCDSHNFLSARIYFIWYMPSLGQVSIDESQNYRHICIYVALNLTKLKLGVIKVRVKVSISTSNRENWQFYVISSFTWQPNLRLCYRQMNHNCRLRYNFQISLFASSFYANVCLDLCNHKKNSS